MNTNMDLVFEVVFNNENSFNNLEANKAKIIVCTYKPAIENKKIIEPIEIEKGITMCDTAYNITRDMIITAKLTVYKNRMNNMRDEVNYEVNYSEIIDDYYKSSDITTLLFNNDIIHENNVFIVVTILLLLLLLSWVLFNPIKSLNDTYKESL